VRFNLLQELYGFHLDITGKNRWRFSPISAVFDPCGNVPAEGDFLSVMQQNVMNLEAVFRE